MAGVKIRGVAEPSAPTPSEAHGEEIGANGREVGGGMNLAATLQSATDGVPSARDETPA